MKVRPWVSPELRARFCAQFGPERTSRAELRFLLVSACEVHEVAAERRAAAEREFQKRWHYDEGRRFRRRARSRLVGLLRPELRNPRRTWREPTWRALAALAVAVADEEAWAAMVVQVAASYASAIDFARSNGLTESVAITGL